MGFSHGAVYELARDEDVLDAHNKYESPSVKTGRLYWSVEDSIFSFYSAVVPEFKGAFINIKRFLLRAGVLREIIGQIR